MKIIQMVLCTGLLLNVVCLASQTDQLPNGSMVEVSFVQKESVEAVCKQIQNEFYINNWARYVVKGAAGAAILSACCFLLKDVTLVTNTRLHDLEGQTARNAGVLKVIVERFPDLCKHVDASSLATQKKEGWGKTFLGFAGGFASNMALSFLYQTVMSKVFYDQTVKWFVEERTMLPAIYDEIKTVKTDISFLREGKVFVSKIQSDRYINALVGLHNNFIEQLEQVVGYLRYKISALDLRLTGKDGNALIAQYLLSRADDVSNILSESRSSYLKQQKESERILMIVDMFDIIEQFSLELKSSLGQFLLIEQKV